MLDKIFKPKSTEVDQVSAFHSEMLQTAAAKGKTAAEQNLPGPNDKLSTFTGVITSAYRSRMAQALKPYSGNMSRLMKAEKDTLTQNKQQNEKQLERLRENRRTLKLELGALAFNDYESHKTLGLWAVIICLGSFEGIFSFPAVKMFDSSNALFQYVLLAGLIAFFIVLPRSLNGIYRATADVANGWIIRAITVCVVLAGFWVIAVLRTSYLQNIGSTTLNTVQVGSAMQLKPIFFLGISCLFLVTTCYCDYLIPTREEKKSNLRAKQLDQKIADLDRQISGLESEVNSIPDTLYSSEKRFARQRVEADAIRDRFEGMHQEALYAFISSNQANRAGEMPACFSAELPKLNKD